MSDARVEEQEQQVVATTPMMPPTTEIELNEVNEAPAGSPIKKVGKGLARAGTATKKKGGRRLYWRQTAVPADQFHT